MKWFNTVVGWANTLRDRCTGLIRKLRPPLTAPLCRFLIRLHINQTHLTLIRFAALIGFYFAFTHTAFVLSLVLVLLAWVLDCLDGDVSRMLGRADAAGAFEDLMGDNFACLVFPLALMQTGRLNPVWGGLFIFAAFTEVWLANRISNGSDLVFQPQADIFLSLSRKAVWIVMYLFLFFRISFFNPVFAAAAVVLCVAIAAHYFQIIRSRL